MNFSQENDYIKKLRERGAKSHIYRKHQLTGLTLSKILQDEKHKILYMRLAQMYDETELTSLAKRIAERDGIRNKGAYFMKLLDSVGLKKIRIIAKKQKKKKVIQKTIFDALRRRRRKKI